MVIMNAPHPRVWGLRLDYEPLGRTDVSGILDALVH